jgi:hypothetical protein
MMENIRLSRLDVKLTEQEEYITRIHFPSLLAELELDAGFDRDNMGYVYSRIGNYYRWKGNYPKDLEYQKKALQAADCTNCLIRPYIRSQIALANYYLGSYDKAISQLHFGVKDLDNIDVDELATVRGFTRESPYYIRTLIYTYLALSYYQDGHPKEAEGFAREAIESSYGYKRTQEYRLPMALGLRVLGAISIDNDKAVDAVKYLKQSLKVLEEGGSEKSRKRYSDIINNQKLYLARAYYLMKDYDNAFNTLSDIARPTHEFQWRAHFLKGKIYHDQDRPVEAIMEFKKSINEVERARTVLGKHGYKVSFMNDKQKPYSQMIKTLFQLNRYDEAFLYAEKAKARAFLDLLANVEDVGKKDRETEVLLSKEKEFKDKIDELQTRLEVESEDDGHSVVKRDTRLALRSVKNELKLFYKRNTESNLDFASIKAAHILGIPEIQRLVDTDLSVINYYYDEKNLYVWAFNSSLSKSVVKPLPEGGLGPKVSIYRELLFHDIIRPSKDLTVRLEKLENQLFELLLGDILHEIKTEKIYIIPHKVLHYLPFQALRHETGYLVEDFQIGYCPSATALKYVFAKRKEKGVDMLALGNPDLGLKDMDLPEAEEEVIFLAKIFPNSKILIRKNASEKKLKALAGSYDIIHIASHADFNSMQPLESSLRLAATGEDDGRLTTKEVFDIKLNAYLVTLSGCETGLGKITHGDEVTGLSRAFIYAGTPSILGSLWKVQDEPTRMLMEKFYKNLRRMDKFNALQQAQLDMINDSKYGRPFFWAPFQIFGDYY